MSEAHPDYGIILKQYRRSIAKEIVRKSIHLCSALIPYFLGRSFFFTAVLLVAALIFYVVSEILRLRGFEVPFIARITEAAARKRDENKFVLGPVTLVAGILLAAFLLQPTPCKIGVYALAFGDGLASFAGKLFGRLRIPLMRGKTAAGSLTCFFAVFIASFAVCRQAVPSFILAALATFIEVLPLTDFDNLIIPTAIGWTAQFFLGL